MIETLCSVKGKLPGNVDLIFRLAANQQKGYVHDLFLEWFEECQSTVINLRVLGVDKVGPITSSTSAGGSLSKPVVYHNGL